MRIKLNPPHKPVSLRKKSASCWLNPTCWRASKRATQKPSSSTVVRRASAWHCSSTTKPARKRFSNGPTSRCIGRKRAGAIRFVFMLRRIEYRNGKAMSYVKAVLLAALGLFAVSAYAQDGAPAQIEMGASLDALDKGHANWRKKKWGRPPRGIWLLARKESLQKKRHGGAGRHLFPVGQPLDAFGRRQC